MKWLLIFWMFHGQYDSFGVQPTPVEFNNEADCKQAFQQIKAVNDGVLHLYGICIRKEDTK